MSFTVSLITQAATYSTVNAINGSGMWFQADTASYSLSNFKYIFDLYQKDITTGAIVQSLGQYQEPPRPFNSISNLTGTGLFNPYKALRSVINNQPDFPINVHGIQPVTQSYVRYGIDYGFSYNPGFTFSTQPIDILGTNFLALDFSSPVDILGGDIITINMITNLYNPQYNTTTQVVDITGGTQALLPILYGVTPSTVEIGQITNLLRIVGTAGDFYGWNGTRQYEEGGLNYADFHEEFVLTGDSNNQFLTDYNNYIFFGTGSPTFSLKPTNIGQYETIGFLSEPSSPIDTINIITFDSFGNQLSNTNHGATGISYPSRKYELGVGTQNLIEAYGINFTNVAYYEIILMDVADSNIERGWIMRRINYDCNYCFYNPIQVTFLNRRGSYEYYTFNKDSKRTVQITKKEWMNNMPWNFEQGQRINSVLSQNIEIDYSINTDWISEYDYSFLEELASSPEVYIISGINRIPIYITDTSYTTKTQVRDVIFNLNINYKYAFPLIQQDN